MANIINFASHLNARRANAAAEHQDAAKRARVEAKVDKVIADLESLVGKPMPIQGQQLVSAIIHQDAEKAESRYVPAYCDPHNEVRGSKYDASKGLRPAEIAARIRQDIKDAQARGEIDKAVKTSVRTSTYAGGYSIDVKVTAAPAGFRQYVTKAAAWFKQFPNQEHRCPMAWADMQSEELRDLTGKLEAIRGAYNRDNSDSMVDYFDTRFYGSVGLDYDLSKALRAADIAAAPNDYWAE